MWRGNVIEEWDLMCLGQLFGFDERDDQVLAALSYVCNTLITHQENFSISCPGTLMLGLTSPSTSALNHEAVSNPSIQACRYRPQSYITSTITQTHLYTAI